MCVPTGHELIVPDGDPVFGPYSMPKHVAVTEVAQRCGLLGYRRLTGEELARITGDHERGDFTAMLWR